MNPLRVVLITQRFWPLVGGDALMLSNLATGLQQQGAQLTILTAQWAKSWPKQMVYCDIPVVRMPRPQGVWGRFRFLRALSHWLRRPQHEIHLASVWGMKHDAYAAISALQHSNVPVVLQSQRTGMLGDCHWQNSTRVGARVARRCRQADAFIATNETAEQELIQADYPRDRVHRIASGVCIPAPRNDALRKAARRALTKAHPILEVADHTPLAVFVERLHEVMGLRELVRAWQSIVTKWPDARLWILGEGPYGGRLWKQIQRMELTDQVILPGSFDDMTEIYYAADVFVLPPHEETTSLSLLEAMGAGVPVVITDPLQNGGIKDIHATVVPAQDPEALACAIEGVFEDRDSCTHQVNLARQLVKDNWSVKRMVSQQWQLFQQLVTDKKKPTCER